MPYHPSQCEYVLDKLGVGHDGFYAGVFCLIGHADGNNLALIRAAWPRLVRAYDAWVAADGAEFEIPEEGTHAAPCGCEVVRGGTWTVGQLRAHKGHTVACMFLWLLMRTPGERDIEQEQRLTDCFHAFVNILGEQFPESTELFDPSVRP
jgi:hypothetical protein